MHLECDAFSADFTAVSAIPFGKVFGAGEEAMGVARSLRGGVSFARADAEVANVVLHDGEAGLAAEREALAEGHAVVAEAEGVTNKCLTPGSCFVAGTQVVVGVNADGSYITKNIEDIQIGDHVLSRDQNDPGAPLEEREVISTSSRQVRELNQITIRSQDGQTETLSASQDHPFYVQGLGWMPARALSAGEWLLTADGQTATVTGNVAQTLNESVSVYNFEVDGDHSYFVEQDIADSAIWVHNGTPCDFTSELLVSKQTARSRLATALDSEVGDFLAAHHIIPLDLISDPRTADILRRAARGGFNINATENGILLSQKLIHRGGHPVYIEALANKVSRISASLTDQETAEAVQAIATKLKTALPNVKSLLR